MAVVAVFRATLAGEIGGPLAFTDRGRNRPDDERMFATLDPICTSLGS